MPADYTCTMGDEGNAKAIRMEFNFVSGSDDKNLQGHIGTLV